MRVSATILLVYCIFLLPPLCFCINCSSERVELDLSHPPPPHSSNLSSTDFSADRQCLGGGEDWVRGMNCPAPTPQAGRVTVSVWGGEDWGQGDGRPRPHATRVRVGGIRAGGKVAPCPHATWIWRD
jgi:hypothetical protein